MGQINDTQRKFRVKFLGGCFAVAFGVLLTRAIAFQLVNTSKLESVAIKQYKAAVRQATKRGEILDAKGRPLAISLVEESLYADPQKIETKDEIAAQLAKLLGENTRIIKKQISSNKRFVWLRRWADPRTVESVLNLKNKGVSSLKEHKRSYPLKTLASSLLGAVGYDGQPLGGIELEYNDLLATSNAEDLEYLKDARGKLYVSAKSEYSFQYPHKIYLTIDITIQSAVEKALKDAVERLNAKSGVAVAMDPNTGAILAMANVPDFDPNNYKRYSFDKWRNRVITDSWEPGSVFKTLIVASAIDGGLISANDKVFCENGKWLVGNKIVKDSHPHGELTIADVIKVSSNIGMGKLAQSLGKEELYNMAQKFGIGKKTGIDLPGEVSGSLSDPKYWSDMQEINFAFGQGVAVTPLQMVVAYSAIANGGLIVKPYLVQKIEGENSVQVRETQIIGRAISEATAKQITQMLKTVVQEGGTATLANSEEYEVAGKTGTAQKALSGKRGYADGKYFSSFVGYAPANNPKIVLFIGIDEPPEKEYYGGVIVAPVFKKIIDEVLPYLRVPSDKPVMVKNDKEIIKKEDTKNLSSEENILVDNNNLEQKKIVKVGNSSWIIPNFYGMTMRDVIKSIENIPLNINVSGFGTLVSQNPKAGTVVSEGAICKLVFKEAR